MIISLGSVRATCTSQRPTRGTFKAVKGLRKSLTALPAIAEVSHRVLLFWLRYNRVCDERYRWMLVGMVDYCS